MCATPFADLSDEERGLVFYYTIFPTLFLSLHPDYVLVHRCGTAAPNATIYHEMAFPPMPLPNPVLIPSDAVRFWNMTNKQVGISANWVSGVQSRAYTPG